MVERVDEIADGVIRISVHRPDGLRGGSVYNQFLILGKRPLLVTVSAHVAPTLRRLAGMQPGVLAAMHGPAYVGDGAAALLALAEYYGAVTSVPAAPVTAL